MADRATNAGAGAGQHSPRPTPKPTPPVQWGAVAVSDLRWAELMQRFGGGGPVSGGKGGVTCTTKSW